MATSTDRVPLYKRISLKWLYSWMLPDVDDPVCHCDLYKEKGCSHVDGYLCNFPDCPELKKFRADKHGHS